MTSKSILACLAGLFFACCARSQASEEDSLLALDLSRYHDTIKLEVYDKLIRSGRSVDTVLKFSRKLIALGERYSEEWVQKGHRALAGAYMKKGDYQSSLNHQFISLELVKKSGNVNFEGLMIIQLADTYSEAGDRTNASKYYNEAISHLQQNQGKYDSVYLMQAYLNYSDEMILSKDFDSAQSLIMLAYPIGEALKDQYRSVKKHLATLTGNMGIVNAEKGNYEQAEKQINLAIEKLRYEFEDFANVSAFLHYLADLSIKQGDYHRAVGYLDQSLEIAQRQGLMAEMRDIHQKLAMVYQILGRYRKAFDAQSLYIAFRDSINNEEVIQRMANLRTEYEVGQKQVEVDLLTAEKKTQKVIMVAIAAFALVLFILAIVIYQYYQSKARINRVLEQQKAELERLNQTKDKFFSIISHDLRGPVSSFMGISRMIKFLVEHKETEQLLEVADDIDHSVERLSELLDNLLTWAMQQQGHFPNVPEKLYLKEMANDLVSTLANMAKGKNIALTSTIEEDITLWADKNTTMTILRNLVNNALKFTPEGGRVIISADQKGDFAEVSVSDTGVGIPQEKLDKLFRLQDKKSTYGTSGEKGLGLGLQLVYEFIEMNHGSITVESEEGNGTTFRIQLPLFEGVGVGV